MSSIPASGTIRAAQAQDRAAIIDVVRASGLFSPDAPEALAEVRTALDGFLTGVAAADRWLTTDTGTSIAATAYYAPERMTDGTWNLYLLAVHPDYQGQGRGAALVRHVEQDLRAAGARVLLIETSGVPGFAGQRAFYAALGYHEEARIRDFYESGDDKVIYWKALLAAR
ncbi:MAG: GNAT family N-acetyltransferase [Actinomycetota bacterium]|nr:GNAT family N-acetyltransferase [Actinomycetota bacterium]